MMNQPNSHRPPEGILRPHGALVGFVQRLADVGLICSTLIVPYLAFGYAWTTELTAALALAILSFLTFSSLTGLYRSWRGATLREECGVLVTTWLASVPALLLAAFLTKTSSHFSRLIVTMWLVGAPASAILLRVIVRGFLRRARMQGHNLRRVAIAGVTESGVRLWDALENLPESGHKLVGMFDDRAPARLKKVPVKGHSIGGTIPDLIQETREGKIDVVYIALPLRAEKRIRELIAQLADTTATVLVLTDLFMFDLMQARWSTVENMPVVSVFDTPFHGLGGWVKRAEDVVLSAGILMLIAVPMLFIAAAVKLTSKGPVFFQQTRYGLNGKPIRVLKFRSMTTMDDGATVKQATKNDARVTPLGRFLRRSSLDELPQFINVLRGDMSVVGPRPHAVAHNELYRGKIRGYMLRHKVKPGITGWAQVNGWRGETEVVEKMEQRVEHDLYYIDNWSLLWDLKIVLLTIFGKNARSRAY